MPEGDLAALTLTDVYVMLAVRNGGPEITVTGVHEHLTALIGSRAVFPSIHRSITRLSERGCLGTARTTPTPVRGGRARSLYSLTAAGITALDATLAVLDAVRAGTPYENRPPATANAR
jgi:hypothetical protein